MEEREKEVLHWTQIQGNPFLYNIEASMLLPDGMIRTCRCRPIGKTKYASSYHDVRFDRKFVVKSVSLKLFGRLGIDSLQFYTDLINEAWQDYKSDE